jgi:hypothetical protein
MVECTVGDGSENMYTKMWNAAQRRNDTEMLGRLCGVPNGDLVAADT